MATLKASERMKIQRQAMPECPPDERNKHFREVNLGLPPELASIEAKRCLACKNHECVAGCPVGIDIPGFIAALEQGDLEKAANVLYAANVLPGITGRVCPQETQCEELCLVGKKGKPVAIGYLERYVADWARLNLKRAIKSAPATGKKVAIVGSGPAGLTCAGELAKLGHQVHVFEALHRPGGVLVYGIPEFRLPKAIVDQEVKTLEEMGVHIECNVVVGATVTLDSLIKEEGFAAVFVGNGAGLPVFQNIPGENLKGVYSANEYLTRVNLMSAYLGMKADTPVLRGQGVVVCGGGNTAMDAVRTARRLGANPACLVYRRSEKEMPARVEEVHHAKEEGVRFEMLTNPVEVLGDEAGWVSAVRCQRMGLGEPDASGRRRPVPIAGSEFDIPCQVFIEAVGTKANPLLTQATPDLKLNKWGNIIVDDFGMTSLPGVFAGGDIVRGGATVILAMGDGKKAAAGIHSYLSQSAA